MGTNLSHNTVESLKDFTVNEKKLRLSKNNNLRIEDYSPKVMTTKEITKERIESYQFIM
jgi:hypothetical protein